MNTDNDKTEGKAGVNSDSEHDQEKLGGVSDLFGMARDLTDGGIAEPLVDVPWF
ncbi:hypothetical protein M2305_003174 [Gluconobacter cerinus]|uniref:hypothetical protein n=1 Tax=Gluconobacter cerinus TaxID=38307 RepID=UPI0022266894|nr:hypothetical protein [Gluconobacter cerinus]MCW2267155.1 hypothetical protein [Gluconobacter cerinus]